MSFRIAFALLQTATHNRSDTVASKPAFAGRERERRLELRRMPSGSDRNARACVDLASLSSTEVVQQLQWSSADTEVMGLSTAWAVAFRWRVNTGTAVVFTLPPPQCSMEVRLGYGLSGPRAQGPVTVGDPLTLVITMTSVLRDVDILVSNCVAHNGADQKLQLVDVHGCTLQERLLSAFRGSHSTRAEGGQEVALFAFLKAFRFTGSRALYVECDVHMCHSSCPAQQCSWRQRRKRSAALEGNDTATPFETLNLFQALEVLHTDADAQQSLPYSGVLPPHILQLHHRLQLRTRERGR
ncbi:hypothetical protein HPB51_015268 [Rhipicephalus microplus]|uniref:ZP domain-containing protein n=1 Tax=Rhipicephalus microplus TaxID=6941 RepID=A0A9J6DP84_RHIMP|nr:hypothetical protein HPB51_015268 [Rhipicephalus microplus]